MMQLPLLPLTEFFLLDMNELEFTGVLAPPRCGDMHWFSLNSLRDSDIVRFLPLTLAYCRFLSICVCVREVAGRVKVLLNSNPGDGESGIVIFKFCFFFVSNAVCLLLKEFLLGAFGGLAG